MILMERELPGFNLDIRLEFDPLMGIQVEVRDDIGVPIWVRNFDTDGKMAMDVFNHPFAHGFELEGALA